MCDFQPNERDRLPSPKKRFGSRGRLGFSLVEMSIVMVILGAVVGGGVATFSGVREKQQRQKADGSMEKIREALVGYAVTNKVLPCPDVGADGAGDHFDGKGDVGGNGKCVNDYGVLPWRDLGLQPFDPWNNYYFYHASSAYSDTQINCNTSGSLELTLKANSGPPKILIGKAPFVVVSHGRNGCGHIESTPVGISPYISRAVMVFQPDGPCAGDEGENTNDDINYLQGAGDDVVLSISPMLFYAKLMDAGAGGALCASATTSSPSTTSSATSPAKHIGD